MQLERGQDVFDVEEKQSKMAVTGEGTAQRFACQMLPVHSPAAAANADKDSRYFTDGKALEVLSNAGMRWTERRL